MVNKLFVARWASCFLAAVIAVQGTECINAQSTPADGGDSELAVATGDADDPSDKQPDGKSKSDGKLWKPLLAKQGLKGWEVTDFGGDGQVHRRQDVLVIEAGDPLNGITTTRKDLPKENYEIYLEARRVEGNDFLCGLTFPVGDEFCSFIAGRWGGTVVGLSSVDGADASENETTAYYDFENGKWYRFRIRVDDTHISAWLDDEACFRQERGRHEFSTRIEVYASQPLGLCAYLSKVEVRKFRWRPLKPAKASKDAKPSPQASKEAEKAIEVSEPPG